jgi:hypothetical protein
MPIGDKSGELGRQHAVNLTSQQQRADESTVSLPACGENGEVGTSPQPGWFRFGTNALGMRRYCQAYVHEG